MLLYGVGDYAEWLTKPVDECSSDPSFQKCENFVKTAKVINDSAERGVKLISDFATAITTDEKQRAWC